MEYIVSAFAAALQHEFALRQVAREILDRMGHIGIAIAHGYSFVPQIGLRFSRNALAASRESGMEEASVVNSCSTR